MKIFIGADHRGFKFKNKVVEILKRQGYEPVDLGTYTDQESCDYPVIAYKVAKEVVRFKNSRGILLCMSGIGQAIAANKVNGAYAALCYNPTAAMLSRAHNNANIIVLSSKFIKSNHLSKIIKNFLETKFEGGRHLRRVNQDRKSVV